MKFGQNMDVGDQRVDLEGQGHSSKVMVTKSKKLIFRSNLSLSAIVIMVKGHMDQSQRSPGPRSKVMWVYVSIKVII